MKIGIEKRRGLEKEAEREIIETGAVFTFLYLLYTVVEDVLDLISRKANNVAGTYFMDLKKMMLICLYCFSMDYLYCYIRSSFLIAIEHHACIVSLHYLDQWFNVCNITDYVLIFFWSEVLSFVFPKKKSIFFLDTLSILIVSSENDFLVF